MKTTSVLVALATCAWLACGKSASDYAKKSKSSEAHANLTALYKGAEMYYNSEHVPPGSMTPLALFFPAPSVGPTPAKGACCKSGGKCAPDAAQWQHPVWQALRFSVDDPHYFSYEYEVEDNATATDGSNRFTVFAYGDLDCDGKFSTYELTGVVDSNYGDGVTSAGSIMEIHPLE